MSGDAEILFDPPLEYDLSDNPGKVRFQNLAELSKWATKERQIWDELLEPLRPAGYYHQMQNQQKRGSHLLTDAVQEIRSLYKQAKPDEDIDQKIREVSRLKEGFQHYTEGRCLHSDSAKGQYITELFKSAGTKITKAQKLALLAAAIQLPIEPQDSNTQNLDLRSALDAHIHWQLRALGADKGVTALSEAHEAALQALKHKWDSTLSEHAEKHRLAEKAITATRVAIDLLHSDQKERFDAYQQETEQRIKDFETRHREGLATEAPATYWKAKAARHRWVAVAAAVLFSVVGGAAIFWLSKNLSNIHSLHVVPPSDALMNEAPTALNSWLTTFVAFIVPFFFVVWFLRLVVRIFLSNLALADDASERVMMLQTFRSLLEHDEGKLQPEDRILMLQALFRPAVRASDDDGAPPNWFDLILNRIKPRG